MVRGHATLQSPVSHRYKTRKLFSFFSKYCGPDFSSTSWIQLPDSRRDEKFLFLSETRVDKLWTRVALNFPYVSLTYRVYQKLVHLGSPKLAPSRIVFCCVLIKLFNMNLKKRCCEVGPRRPHKLRLCSPLPTPLFHEHLHRVFGVLLYAVSEFCDTNFASQVVYKPWVLSVSPGALVPITAILVPAADCVLLLHRLVIGLVTVHSM